MTLGSLGIQRQLPHAVHSAILFCRFPELIYIHFSGLNLICTLSGIACSVTVKCTCMQIESTFYVDLDLVPPTPREHALSFLYFHISSGPNQEILDLIYQCEFSNVLLQSSTMKPKMSLHDRPNVILTIFLCNLFH